MSRLGFTVLPVLGLSPVLVCDAVGLVVLSPLLGRSATAPKHQQRLMLLAMVILDAITGIWMLLQYAYEVCINHSSLLAEIFLPLASNATLHLIANTTFGAEMFHATVNTGLTPDGLLLAVFTTKASYRSVDQAILALCCILLY